MFLGYLGSIYALCLLAYAVFLKMCVWRLSVCGRAFVCWDVHKKLLLRSVLADYIENRVKTLVCYTYFTYIYQISPTILKFYQHNRLYVAYFLYLRNDLRPLH